MKRYMKPRVVKTMPLSPFNNRGFDNIEPVHRFGVMYGWRLREDWRTNASR